MIKKRYQRYKNSAVAAEYLNTLPIEQWKTKEFVDYFFLLKETCQGVLFFPSYHREILHIFKLFLERYGAMNAKKILYALFIFRKELGIKYFSIQMLSSVKCQVFLDRALERIRAFEEQQLLPSWAQKHQSSWTDEDYRCYRQYLEGRKNHGTAEKK